MLDGMGTQVVGVMMARLEGAGQAAEQPVPASSGAGDARRTGKSSRHDPLRDWSENDVVEVLMPAGGAAPARGGDGAVDPPRRLLKTADAGPSHTSAAREGGRGDEPADHEARGGPGHGWQARR